MLRRTSRALLGIQTADVQSTQQKIHWNVNNKRMHENIWILGAVWFLYSCAAIAFAAVFCLLRQTSVSRFHWIIQTKSSFAETIVVKQSKGSRKEIG